MINDDDCSNPYYESNDTIVKKILTILLTCVVIKTIIIEIIRIFNSNQNDNYSIINN